MAESFREVGVPEELAQSLEAAAITRPTALQRAAIPVLRRGGNLVMNASSGAGITHAYGIPLVERVAQQEGGVRALVVTPTEERAVKAAEQLARIAAPLDIRVAAMVPAWSTEGAQILVVTAGRLLPLMRTSQLKLDDVKTIVLDGLSAMLSLGAAEAVETLFASAPKDTQKVIVTGAVNDAVNKLVDAHVRKALHVPARPAVVEFVEPVPPVGTLRYAVVSRAATVQTLLLFIEDEPATPTVFVRHPEPATSIRKQIELRGLDAKVAPYGTGSAGPAIGYGAPSDADALTSSLRSNDLVIVTPDELAHLQQIARQVNFELKHQEPPEGKTAALERFREALRGALRDEDVEAQLLVIAPLFDEYSPAEVAAAAVALLRKRTARAAAAAGAVSERETEERPRGTAPFVKLFLSVGSKDGVGPRDIVGTITGEAGVKGDQVGRVEIRDTFSIVEVDATIADRVIQALNGTSVRGRSVRADYDRKGVGGPRGGDGPRSGGPRGGDGPRGGGPRGGGPRGGDGPRGGSGGPRGGSGGPRGGSGGPRGGGAGPQRRTDRPPPRRPRPA